MVVMRRERTELSQGEKNKANKGRDNILETNSAMLFLKMINLHG